MTARRRPGGNGKARLDNAGKAPPARNASSPERRASAPGQRAPAKKKTRKRTRNATSAKAPPKERLERSTEPVARV